MTLDLSKSKWISSLVQAHHEQAARQLINRITEIITLSPHDRVCDIGCGYGATAQVLAENYNVNVTGVTITPTQYEIAKQIRPSQGQVHFRLENWLDNILESNSFDHAIAIESSEHAVDKHRYFEQAYRILKLEGDLTFCAWMQGDNISLLSRNFLLVPICNEGRLPSLLTESDYRRVLESNGFEITHIEDLTQRVKNTWNYVLRNLLHYILHHPLRFLGQFKALIQNRNFLWTPYRMKLAYKTKALRYVLVNAKKKI